MKRFKAEHPVCYFCATAPTETEDHVPSRECFRDRVWPEGYVFPACARCNSAAGNFEQVVALYLMMFNHDEGEPPREQFLRLIKGVKNNNSDLMPRIGGANVARRHFREKGIRLPPGMAYADIPIAELPDGNRAALELFTRRLICALYYKEIGRPVPLDYHIAAGWLPFSDPAAPQFTAQVSGWLPEITQTNRRNTNIGDQFTYLWGVHSDGEIFVATAQFSKSFFFFGAAVAPVHYQEHRGWKQHCEDVAELDGKLF